MENKIRVPLGVWFRTHRKCQPHLPPGCESPSGRDSNSRLDVTNRSLGKRIHTEPKKFEFSNGDKGTSTRVLRFGSVKGLTRPVRWSKSLLHPSTVPPLSGSPSITSTRTDKESGALSTESTVTSFVSETSTWSRSFTVAHPHRSPSREKGRSVSVYRRGEGTKSGRDRELLEGGGSYRRGGTGWVTGR